MTDETAPARPALAFTGERFVPGARGEIWIEHWHRYHFAARWVRGKRVLDVACGEGYGTALLARHAAHVTGADLSGEAIEHAKGAYAALANAQFVIAPCTRLPLADASIDVAVSFETVEHIGEQEEFIDELARVLKPDGVLILSCPNKLEYSDKRRFANEFHVKELYREELGALVARRFPESVWFGQKPTFYSLIAPETLSPALDHSIPAPEGTPGGGRTALGELVETDEKNPMEARASLTDPLYFVLVASRAREAIEAVAPTLSVLADRDDWVHRDYEKVMGELQMNVAWRESLEDQVARREVSIAALQDEARVSQAAKGKLDEALAQREATIAALQADLAARNFTLVEKEHEVNRRAGWRWWLKLPLIRLGILKQI